MKGSIEIKIKGETLTLLPEKAILWKDTLFVSDTHFGKAATFRSFGIPLNADNSPDDLDKLTRVINYTEAQKLIFLGDFFHAKAGKTKAVLDEVKKWRDENSKTEMILIRGNHDKHSGDPPEDFNIAPCKEPLITSPFALRHMPVPTEDLFTLAGHIHPSVTLRGHGQMIRFPCFHFTDKVAVLPSFGSFTGSADIKPATSDRIFVIAESTVMEV